MSDTFTVVDYFIKQEDGRVAHVRKIGGLPLELIDMDAPVVIFDPKVRWIEQSSLIPGRELVLWKGAA